MICPITTTIAAGPIAFTITLTFNPTLPVQPSTMMARCLQRMKLSYLAAMPNGGGCNTDQIPQSLRLTKPTKKPTKGWADALPIGCPEASSSDVTLSAKQTFFKVSILQSPSASC
jgi:hypothetical protein